MLSVRLSHGGIADAGICWHHSMQRGCGSQRGGEPGKTNIVYTARRSVGFEDTKCES